LDDFSVACEGEAKFAVACEGKFKRTFSLIVFFIFYKDSLKEVVLLGLRPPWATEGRHSNNYLLDCL
jgi:hypothetical protein